MDLHGMLSAQRSRLHLTSPPPLSYKAVMHSSSLYISEVLCGLSSGRTCGDAVRVRGLGWVLVLF